MSCSKTKLVSVYLDNEMRPAEKAAFEAHMPGCADCSQAFERSRSLSAAFRTAEHYQAPFGFSTRVMAKAAALEPRRSPWFLPLFIRFAEAAVLLVIITVGILAGTLVMSSAPAAITTTTTLASSLSLDLFDATPPGSLGGAYLAMMEADHEK